VGGLSLSAPLFSWRGMFQVVASFFAIAVVAVTAAFAFYYIATAIPLRQALSGLGRSPRMMAKSAGGPMHPLHRSPRRFPGLGTEEFLSAGRFGPE
jgi:hypothetical protein